MMSLSTSFMNHSKTLKTETPQSLHFAGKIKVEIGYDPGQMRGTESFKVLELINGQYFSKLPRKCDMVPDFDGPTESVSYNYLNHKDAGAALASYLVQHGIKFNHELN
ncbi:MAG: hypothetical protein K2X66_02430 [Cyanobacteria bacterium]|nr:hypothetical protein [Cyanobacteriota bacterium]